MATLKSKVIKEMNEKDRKKKLEELQLELVKSSSGAAKSGSSRAREIRKIIARILTLNKSLNREELKKQ